MSTVEIADPTKDSPRWWTLLLTAVLAAALGFGLARFSLAAPRPEQQAQAAALAAEGPDAHQASAQGAQGARAAQGAQDAEAAGPAAPDAGTHGSEAESEAENLAAVQDAPTEDAEDAGEDTQDPREGAEDAAAPAGDDVDDAPSSLELEHGRVAYLHCSGACPRDHGLERDVWRVLERVGGCVNAAGEGDVRVRLRGGAVDDVRFRERGAEGIDISTLHRCLSPPLSRLAGSSLGDSAVVSFRFTYR